MYDYFLKSYNEPLIKCPIPMYQNSSLPTNDLIAPHGHWISMNCKLKCVGNRHCKDHTVIRKCVESTVMKELIPAELEDDSTDTQGEPKPLIW